MGSLFGILGIANEALQAQQAGISVTSNNIANVNTPGYSREIAELSESPAAVYGAAGSGGGVDVDQVQSVRDSVLNYQVNQETQAQNQSSAFTGQMAAVQNLFATTGGAGLNTAIDGFFSSLQQLSTQPSSATAASAVIDAAQGMAQSFNQVAGAVGQQQSAANTSVLQAVSQVNGLLQQVASLNGQIADAQSGGQDANPLEDQMQSLLGNLSQLISFQETDAGNGELTVTTAGGEALVTGTQATQLTTSVTPSGMSDIYSGTTDITAGITGGSLGGLIQARDQTLPGLLGQLNSLATGIANAVNAQNQQGYTPGGAAGGNLFTPPGDAAAANLSLATTDPTAIATSSAPGAGDNANVLALAGLQQQGIVSGVAPDAAYANIVASLGSVVSNANAQQQASSTMLTQLQNQLSSVSGVSLNQESINLTQFEQAYQAAAQIVQVLNSLAQTTVNMATIS